MNEVTTQIIERLDLLAAKLGVTAEHMWEVLITQGYIAGIYGIAYIVISILGFAGGAWTVTKCLSCDVDEEFLGFMGLMCGCGLMLASVILAVNGLDDTRYIFNPEYFALKEIGSLLK